jgi:hypothetical protein
VKRHLIGRAFDARKLTMTALLAGSVALSGLASPGAARSSPAVDETYDVTGLVGVASGDTVEVSIANAAPETCTAVLRLVDVDGATVASRSVTVGTGREATMSTSLRSATELRASVDSIGGSCTEFAPTLEVIDRAGRLGLGVSIPLSVGVGVSLSSGPLRITPGLEARLNVSNVAATECVGMAELVDARGGILASQSIRLVPGVSASLTFAPSTLARIRGVILPSDATCDAVLATLEAVNTTSGRSLDVVAVGDTLG